MFVLYIEANISNAAGMVRHACDSVETISLADLLAIALD